MSPEILDLDFKMGTLNPETFKSGEFCCLSDFLSNLDIFCQRPFEFAVEPKWRIE